MNIVSIPRYAAMTLSCKPLNLISYHIIAIAIGNQIYWCWFSSSNLFFKFSLSSMPQCIVTTLALNHQNVTNVTNSGLPDQKILKANAKSVKARLRTWVCSDMMCYQCAIDV